MIRGKSRDSASPSAATCNDANILAGSVTIPTVFDDVAAERSIAAHHITVLRPRTSAARSALDTGGSLADS
ncbi:hypothetical protein [Saccharopolyspora sp. NPDC002578]